jgi:hypothetical protein
VTTLTFVWYVFLSPSLSSFVTFLVIFVVVIKFFLVKLEPLWLSLGWSVLDAFPYQGFIEKAVLADYGC